MDSISATSEEILALSADELTGISWTNGETSLSFTQIDGVWQDASDGEFPIDQDKMADLLAHFESVTASFIIEDVEDFTQYGLASPHRHGDPDHRRRGKRCWNWATTPPWTASGM